ncbi:sulfurtransferase [Enemella dayhoffiae]|uniref:Sulfurtransferase n=1 Tax=Enemella dayhoffiae TaxID=2016507 RepID=A0A255H5Z4_9ACTN|nr:sulfurtransferase [Enemella dayhoffiae]OYO21994.1 sulfurtransferase [Enemella dayhoffiae]
MSGPLITPEELAELLAGDEPPVLLDARYPGPAAAGNGLPAFREGHLPGAQWIDVNTELSGPKRPGSTGGRHPLPDPGALQQTLRRLGVRRDSAIVVMDADNSLAAARLWWLLTDAGVSGVRVLDGGFAAWQRNGGAVATGAPTPVPEGDVSLESGQLAVVDADQVAGAEGTVWDVRAGERYRGESEPIDPVAGHIPGARNLPAADAQEPDGRFRDAGQLRELFADVRPGDIVYCGSGITAAQSLLAMTAAGVADGVRLYPGSWSDWISADRPVERG